MYWLFTGVLIAASAGIVALTGYLLHRLFSTAPDPTGSASRRITQAREPDSAS